MREHLGGRGERIAIHSFWTASSHGSVTPPLTAPARHPPAVLLLSQDDLRRSLAVHAEAAVCVFQHCAHGLAGGVKRVHLVEFLLGDLVSDWLVVPLQLQHQAQEGTLSLVAHMAGKAALFLWRLRTDRCLKFGFTQVVKGHFPVSVSNFASYVLLKSQRCFYVSFILHSNLIDDNDLEVETILHGLERFKRIISLAEHKHFPVENETDFKANEGEEEERCNLTFQ